MVGGLGCINDDNRQKPAISICRLKPDSVAFGFSSLQVKCQVARPQPCLNVSGGSAELSVCNDLGDETLYRIGHEYRRHQGPSSLSPGG